MEGWSGAGSSGLKRNLLPVQRPFMLHHVCNQDVQRYVRASPELAPHDSIGGFNNDYFAKLWSHNGQLICNETVSYEVERSFAIRPAEVVTSLSCSLCSPSITTRRSGMRRNEKAESSSLEFMDCSPAHTLQCMWRQYISLPFMQRD